MIRWMAQAHTSQFVSLKDAGLWDGVIVGMARGLALRISGARGKDAKTKIPLSQTYLPSRKRPLHEFIFPRQDEFSCHEFFCFRHSFSCSSSSVVSHGCTTGEWWSCNSSWGPCILIVLWREKDYVLLDRDIDPDLSCPIIDPLSKASLSRRRGTNLEYWIS